MNNNKIILDSDFLFLLKGEISLINFNGKKIKLGNVSYIQKYSLSDIIKFDLIEIPKDLMNDKEPLIGFLIFEGLNARDNKEIEILFNKYIIIEYWMLNEYIETGFKREIRTFLRDVKGEENLPVFTIKFINNKGE